MAKIRNEEVLKKFASKLKEVRASKNLTQEELSYKSGLAVSQIARIETAKLNTTISTIFAIANALEVEPSELLRF